MRVLGVTAFSMASTSKVRLLSGAVTGVAPAAFAAIGYIRNPCRL